MTVAVRAAAVVASLGLLGCFPERDQQQASTGCYSIASPESGVTPHGLVLLNACTGETWVAVRVLLEEAKTGQPAVFTYRWSPLNRNPLESRLQSSS
jgi:hypothetical protein